MMTKDRKGVECDLCGSISREEFSYYSCKITKVDVNFKESKTNPEDRHLDIDWCETCMNKIKSIMLEVIDKREGRAVQDDENKADEWSIQ